MSTKSDSKAEGAESKGDGNAELFQLDLGQTAGAVVSERRTKDRSAQGRNCSLAVGD